MLCDSTFETVGIKHVFMSQKYFQISIIIVLFYTIAQVVCLSVFGYTPYPDSEGYILLAKECVANGTFYPVDLKNIPFIA